MARYTYHFRIQAYVPYNSTMVVNKPTDTRLIQFSELLWHGYDDDEGFCVYRRNPLTKEVVRIDFQSPRY